MGIFLNTVNIDHENFRWTTSFNIALNDNKITDAFYEKISDLYTIRRKYQIEGYPVNAGLDLRLPVLTLRQENI